MTRTQCDELSAPLVRTMLDMEDDILREIAAQLSRDGNVSDTSKWRIRQLARAGRFDKRAASLIAGYSEVQGGQAMDMILTAAETEIGYLDEAVRAANAAGLAEYFSDIPAESSVLSAAKAFQKQAASDLNLVNTVMQYGAGSAYVRAVNSVYRESKKARQEVLDVMGKSAAKAVTGQMSLQEVTRKAIRELAQKGIPAFRDKLGREWTPEAYIMMDMRSTLANTARAAQNRRCDEYGITLISVSSHMGARPLCAPYQGRIFSRDGTSGVTSDGGGRQISYTPLSETSFGKPDGLFGINCGHVQYPFAPGINFQRYFPYPEEENAERYKQFQRQRAMERDIRATKRECMMLQQTGDKEGLKKASIRLRTQKEQYSAFCRSNSLSSHLDRTQVYGYDRSVSSKTVWAERKQKISSDSNVQKLDNGGGSGIIKARQTKLTDSGAISNPMDSKRYMTMKERLERNGCPVIAAHGEDERFLIAFGAEAISDEHGILHLGDVPSASAFFEEIIHYTQMKKYGVASYDYDGIERAAREVAANRKLLRHGKAYGFTDEDFNEISRNLKLWEEAFERKVGVSYDEADFKRDI